MGTERPAACTHGGVERGPGPAVTLLTDATFLLSVYHSVAGRLPWHLLGLSAPQRGFLSIPLPQAKPSHGLSSTGGGGGGGKEGGRDAYLVHLEVEKDSSSHLGDEDQEEEGKVLGTQSGQSQVGPPIRSHSPQRLPPPPV